MINKNNLLNFSTTKNITILIIITPIDESTEMIIL